MAISQIDLIRDSISRTRLNRSHFVYLQNLLNDVDFRIGYVSLCHISHFAD